MFGYIVRRIISFVLVLFLAATIAFVLMYFTPGDPATVMLGQFATEERVASLRQELGLDRPFYERYFTWFAGVLRGDLGISFRLNRPVTAILLKRFPVTLGIATFGVVISVLIGIPAGVLAAAYKDTWVDNFSMILAFTGASFPSFWLGLNLMMVFSVQLGWFPAGGYVSFTESFLGGLRSITLPAFALGFIQSALLARMTRANMVEILREQYIDTARAKGLTEQTVLLKHAFRNAVVPVITIVGISYGRLLGGAAILETVYTLPGVGKLLITAVNNREFMVVQGIIILAAFTYSLVNLVTDLVYGLFDPRIVYK